MSGTKISHNGGILHSTSAYCVILLTHPLLSVTISSMARTPELQNIDQVTGGILALVNTPIEEPFTIHCQVIIDALEVE